MRNLVYNLHMGKEKMQFSYRGSTLWPLSSLMVCFRPSAVSQQMSCELRPRGQQPLGWFYTPALGPLCWVLMPWPLASFLNKSHAITKLQAQWHVSLTLCLFLFQQRFSSCCSCWCCCFSPPLFLLLVFLLILSSSSSSPFSATSSFFSLSYLLTCPLFLCKP